MRARWVEAGPGRDVGADALKVLLDVSYAGVETLNPLGTAGYRTPEPLEEVPGRLRAALNKPVIPVTALDYQEMLEEREDVD